MRLKNNVLSFLLEQGALTELKDRLGWTALFWAVRAKNSEAVHLLINYNATIDIQDTVGFRLLAYAQQKDVVIYLTLQGLIESRNRANLVPVKNSRNSCAMS